MKKLLLIITVLNLCFLSCEKKSDNLVLKLDDFAKDKYYKSEIFTNQYQSIYGKWKLNGVSGGFSGGGHELNFDFLEIKEFGIYGFIRNDSLIEYGKIVIDEPTNNYLKIVFDFDDNTEQLMWDAVKIVRLYGIDTLFLNSPCCDRYNYHFSREK